VEKEAGRGFEGVRVGGHGGAWRVGGAHRRSGITRGSASSEGRRQRNVRMGADGSEEGAGGAAGGGSAQWKWRMGVVRMGMAEHEGRWRETRGRSVGSWCVRGG
jgi:hypothetical protein